MQMINALFRQSCSQDEHWQDQDQQQDRKW